MVIVGLLAAVIAAVLQGSASSVQAFAAVRARGPALLTPLYLVGMAMDGVGWLVSLVALTQLPLLAVEPVLASSLAVTLLLNVILLRVHPTKLGIVAVGLIIASVAVLALAGQPGTAAPAGSGLITWLCVGAALLVVLATIGYHRGWATAMGVIGGLGFGGSSIAARGLRYQWSVLTDPALWLMLLLAGVGTIAFARGLECAGPAGATRVTAWMWSMEITVPSAIGLIFLGDSTRPGWGWAAALAFPVALLATALISSPSAVRLDRGLSAGSRPRSRRSG